MSAPVPYWFKIVKKWIKLYKDQLKQIFQHIDQNKDTFISREELRKCLLEIDQLNFEEADVDVFLEISDSDGDGRVDYNEFVEHLVLLILQYDPSNLAWAKMINKLEQFISIKLKEVFNHLDLDKNGVLDKEEVGKALKEVGVIHVQSEVTTIWPDICDPSTDKVDYKRFIGKLCEILVEYQKKNSQAQDKCKGNDLKLKEIFQKMDKDGNGVISKSEFLEAVKEMDPGNYKEEDAEVLFECADIDENGYIDFTEFVENLVDLMKKYKSL
eukprot:TRINITY_DN2611_c0_g1_i1.p1 TRINITY_DN2611_c0_g1~~TRINITY_DN2611_c0_g1_i1.p1  ORF type:complete len:270 (-),score=79.91 TRINITY_DN2611_c0_g1_i1:70-879(-)